MNIRPLYDKVLIQKIVSEQTTSSGIIIPSDSKVSSCKGQIIAVGTGKTVKGSTEPLQVKQGDIVIFNTYAGSDVSEVIERQHTFLMREEDILAIIEE